MNPDTGFFVIRIRIQNLVFGDHKLKNYIEEKPGENIQLIRT